MGLILNKLIMLIDVLLVFVIKFNSTIQSYVKLMSGNLTFPIYFLNDKCKR